MPKPEKPRKNHWLNRCLIEMRCHYTLCTTQEMFDGVLRKLNVPKRDWPTFATADASTTFLVCEGKQAAVVSMDIKKLRKGKRKAPQVAALLAHEAVHIWQEERRAIGERAPSDEFEAYSVQAITQALLFEYERQTRG